MDLKRGYTFLHIQYFLSSNHWTYIHEIPDSLIVMKDFNFVLLGGITKGNPHKKPIKLCFGKREGSLVFQRVLGCQDHKGLSQNIIPILCGYLTLLHSLQQAGLCLW